MKHYHVFNHQDYYTTLQKQIGGDIPVFKGYRQKGGGFGSIFRIISQYAIPLIKKYIFPRARDSLINTAADVAAGTSLKASVKRNSKSFLKNVASDFVTHPQRGAGKIKKKVTNSIQHTCNNEMNNYLVRLLSGG